MTNRRGCDKRRIPSGAFNKRASPQAGSAVVQVAGGDEGQAALGQGAGSSVDGVVLAQIVAGQVIPITRLDHFVFAAEVVENVGGVAACLLDGLLSIRVAAFVLGRDVLDTGRQVEQFLAAVVRLADDAAPSLGDVVLEAHHVFEAERLAELGGDLDGAVIN